MIQYVIHSPYSWVLTMVFGFLTALVVVIIAALLYGIRNRSHKRMRVVNYMTDAECKNLHDKIERFKAQQKKKEAEAKAERATPAFMFREVKKIIALTQGEKTYATKY